MKDCPPRIAKILNELAAALKQTPSLAEHVREHAAFDLACSFKRRGSPTQRAKLIAELRSLDTTDRIQFLGTLAAIVGVRAEFAQAADPLAGAAPPIPTEAPELWKKRQSGSGENAIGFLRRVYAPWLPAPLSVAMLGRLDNPLYVALKQWSGRHEPPPDLKLFFDTFTKRRSRQEVTAELTRNKIKNPADAFKRFPDDPKTARRLYQAARARLGETFLHESGLGPRLQTTSRQALPFPVLPSHEVMKEKDRRKHARLQWEDRDRSLKETPIEFIAKVYEKRLGCGFTQADLKAVDLGLYNALHQWLQKTDPQAGQLNRIPPTVDLPTLAEWNARRLAQLEFAPHTISDDEKVRLAKVKMGRAIRAAAVRTRAKQLSA